MTLARHIGQRIREARHRAGLTQQQLAGDRYTKAYVSALETGIARPSMVALSFLSERLGLPASHFIDEGHPVWTRLEVDMRLAAGDWQAAADGYQSLLADATDDAVRADLLRGLAEASARLDRGKEADRRRLGGGAHLWRRRSRGRCARWRATGSPTASTSPTTRSTPAASSRRCSSRCVAGCTSSRTSRCGC